MLHWGVGNHKRFKQLTNAEHISLETDNLQSKTLCPVVFDQFSAIVKAFLIADYLVACLGFSRTVGLKPIKMHVPLQVNSEYIYHQDNASV